MVFLHRRALLLDYRLFKSTATCNIIHGCIHIEDNHLFTVVCNTCLEENYLVRWWWHRTRLSDECYILPRWKEVVSVGLGRRTPGESGTENMQTYFSSREHTEILYCQRQLVEYTP